MEKKQRNVLRKWQNRCWFGKLNKVHYKEIDKIWHTSLEDGR